LLLLFAPAPASAVSCDASFAGLNLGDYTGVLSTSGTSSGTLTCPSGFPWFMGLTAGVGNGSSITLRRMTGPGYATLDYRIFRDAGRTMNWGNTANVDARSGSGTGGAQSVTLYPQIPANQFVAPGTYSDIVTMAVFNTSPYLSRSISVVATVRAACKISVTPLAFGSYTGTQKDATGTITVTCTNTTPYNIGLSAGAGTNATVATRAMKGPGTASLHYAMFRDSARSLNWGTTIGTDTLTGRGTGQAAVISVYGRITAGQEARSGTYADTIVATIAY
jgi:spore coat protein U-like protein